MRRGKSRGNTYGIGPGVETGYEPSVQSQLAGELFIFRQDFKGRTKIIKPQVCPYHIRKCHTVTNFPIMIGLLGNHKEQFIVHKTPFRIAGDLR